RVLELGREQPDEIARGRRAWMRTIVGLIGRHGPEHADELRRLRVEAFLVVLPDCFHGAPPLIRPLYLRGLRRVNTPAGPSGRDLLKRFERCALRALGFAERGEILSMLRFGADAPRGVGDHVYLFGIAVGDRASLAQSVGAQPPALGPQLQILLGL